MPGQGCGVAVPVSLRGACPCTSSSSCTSSAHSTSVCPGGPLALSLRGVSRDQAVAEMEDLKSLNAPLNARDQTCIRTGGFSGQGGYPRY